MQFFPVNTEYISTQISAVWFTLLPVNSVIHYISWVVFFGGFAMNKNMGLSVSVALRVTG